jgi:hypothetical protein
MEYNDDVIATILPLNNGFYDVSGDLNHRLKLLYISQQMDRHSRHLILRDDGYYYLVLPKGTVLNIGTEEIKSKFLPFADGPPVELHPASSLKPEYAFNEACMIRVDVFRYLPNEVTISIPKWHLLENTNITVHFSTMCPGNKLVIHKKAECSYYTGSHLGNVYS